MKRRFQLPGRLKWRHSVKWQLLTVAALSPFTFISFYRFGFCCGLDSQKIVLLFPLFQDPSRVQLVSDFSAALPVCAANQTMAQRSNVLIKVETTQLKGTRSRCTQTRPSTLLGQGEMIVFDNWPSFSDKNKQKRHFPFIRLWFEWIFSRQRSSLDCFNVTCRADRSTDIWPTWQVTRNAGRCLFRVNL